MYILRWERVCLQSLSEVFINCWCEDTFELVLYGECMPRCVVDYTAACPRTRKRSGPTSNASCANCPRVYRRPCNARAPGGACQRTGNGRRGGVWRRVLWPGPRVPGPTRLRWLLMKNGVIVMVHATVLLIDHVRHTLHFFDPHNTHTWHPTTGFSTMDLMARDAWLQRRHADGRVDVYQTAVHSRPLRGVFRSPRPNERGKPWVQVPWEQRPDAYTTVIVDSSATIKSPHTGQTERISLQVRG